MGLPSNTRDSGREDALLLPFVLGVSGLKHARRRHEVLNVLPKNLIL